MAWRIDEQVIRGEIDNRVRGQVTGRIWFTGSEAPVELAFTGDAWRDLAGRRLEFINPNPQPWPDGGACDLVPLQRGVIGDCTASRKVKVPEVSMEELLWCYEARKPFPWHLGNSLYLEWYGERNGRVIIESATFTLTISPDIAWDMTPAEEAAQRGTNAAAMHDFMQQLSEAAPAADLTGAREDSEDGEADAAWTDEKPQTEAEAEQMQADSERLAERIAARMRREGPDADYEKILEEELETQARERGENPLTPEEEAKRAAWIDEMNAAAEEALVDPDPEWAAQGETKHPLAERAGEFSRQLSATLESGGLLPEGLSDEHPLLELENAIMLAAAKLAAGLAGKKWPPDVNFCASIIVRVKRAREYYDDAVRALESCQEQQLLGLAQLSALLGEVRGLAEEADAVIADLRTRLERGCD